MNALQTGETAGSGRPRPGHRGSGRQPGPPPPLSRGAPKGDRVNRAGPDRPGPHRTAPRTATGFRAARATLSVPLVSERYSGRRDCRVLLVPSDSLGIEDGMGVDDGGCNSS